MGGVDAPAVDPPPDDRAGCGSPSSRWLASTRRRDATRLPGRIRGWLRHPLLVAVKIWALAHLLANGDADDMLLFGSFLAWAVYDRVAVKRRGDLGAGDLGFPHPRRRSER